MPTVFMEKLLTRRSAIQQFALFLAGSPLLRGQYTPRDDHERIPSLEEIASVFEFEPVARAKITRTSYDYITGGVESEFSLRRNREAFDWATLIPRAVADVRTIDTSLDLLGRPLDFPIFVAPTAAHAQLHNDGEQETYRGATAAGALMAVSNNSSFPLDTIAKAADGPLWAQVYVRRNPDTAHSRVDTAVDSGYLAICLTVDTQWNSARERLVHDTHLRTATAGSQRERRARPRGRRRGVQEKTYPYGLIAQDPDLDWSIIATIRSWTDLPLLLKGILTAEDARLAVQHGVDAIIVSNHGARYLASAPATFEVLEEVVEAVGGKLPVLMDGGIRRGSDVLKALALGAKAVAVGRPPLWGLGAYGAAGAQRALELLRAELVLAMAHTGCASLGDINRGLVRTDFP